MRKTIFAFALASTVLFTITSAGAIVGGTLDDGDPPSYPEVGALVGYYPPAGKEIAYCSGTLISPTVFLTAAHCGFLRDGNGGVRVTFDEKPFDEEYTAKANKHAGKFIPHRDYRSPTYHTVNENLNDVAVVVFDAPIDGITPAELPPEFYLDKIGLDQSSKFTSVGYGDTEFLNGPGGKETTHVQARNYALGSFNALTKQALHLSQNSTTGDGGTCYGDSGGPNFIGAVGETKIIASTTWTGDTYCEATNVTQRVDIPSVRKFLKDHVALP
ncbi:MAG: trypsin-like serine protease [Actinomycetota bacterium]|nr:trypsin-like serine protease [Actinomycetota bacterium]